MKYVSLATDRYSNSYTIKNQDGSILFHIEVMHDAPPLSPSLQEIVRFIEKIVKKDYRGSKWVCSACRNREPNHIEMKLRQTMQIDDQYEEIRNWILETWITESDELRYPNNDYVDFINTPIQLACKNNAPSCVKKLREAANQISDPTLHDNVLKRLLFTLYGHDAKRPLIRACRSRGGHALVEEVLHIMLDIKNENTRDECLQRELLWGTNRSPEALQLACENNNDTSVKLLFDAALKIGNNKIRESTVKEMLLANCQYRTNAIYIATHSNNPQCMLNLINVLELVTNSNDRKLVVRQFIHTSDAVAQQLLKISTPDLTQLPNTILNPNSFKIIIQDALLLNDGADRLGRFIDSDRLRALVAKITINEPSLQRLLLVSLGEKQSDLLLNEYSKYLSEEQYRSLLLYLPSSSKVTKQNGLDNNSPALSSQTSQGSSYPQKPNLSEEDLPTTKGGRRAVTRLPTDDKILFIRAMYAGIGACQRGRVTSGKGDKVSQLLQILTAYEQESNEKKREASLLAFAKVLGTPRAGFFKTADPYNTNSFNAFMSALPNKNKRLFDSLLVEKSPPQPDAASSDFLKDLNKSQSNSGPGV